MKAIVKIFNTRGRYLLEEIVGLTEGTVVDGTINANSPKCFEFTWNGDDAVLWIDTNCYILNNGVKSRKLPKGWAVDVSYVTYKGNVELCGNSKRANVILDTIKFCGLKSSEFKVKCVVTGYNAIDDIFDFPVATCDSKNAAIEEFWQKVDDEHWFERM